ncbi:hypothetical protein BS50DRAFT_507935 [Corynespora cassiicola Philippines]|uniref:Uncharacterized protein n=1 Tax=Corynespora cassiicola Philippines TaxID=1448308 RepID=A0A2T2N2I9_CORCC|nr:hypothetical protein BS50DRAFT_507935 [Corynespora cassiicola Philippines]
MGKETKRQEVDANFVTGVRINCELDLKLNKRPQYEMATIPSSHDIFNQSLIDISVLVKLPIVVQKLPGSLVECFPSGSPWLNQRVAFHHRDCLTRENTTEVEFDEKFGVCPPQWDKSIGTVIAMRLDKKPLYPEHIAALAGFSQVHLSPYFQKYRESWYFEDDGHLPKSYVVQEMTRFKFGQYYHDWREVQMNKESLD